MDKTFKNNIPDQAADWVTRIQSGEVDQRNSAELRAWLEENTEHQRVFQNMVELLSQTDVLSGLDEIATSALRRAQPRQVPAWLAAVATAVVIAAGLTLWMASTSPVHFQTHTGERVLMTLDDGSSVHLNALSSVDIRFTEKERLASMTSGEIVFSVSSADPRPFIVQADGLEVVVTGTEFQVSGYDSSVAVSVLEGTVLVKPLDDSRARAPIETVRAGQQVHLENSAVTAPYDVDPDRVAAWRDGWVYLDGRPLQDLIDRLNRQYDGEIEIVNDSLANSRVSVALKIGQQTETLSRLELLLPVTVEELPGNRRIIHARRP